MIHLTTKCRKSYTPSDRKPTCSKCHVLDVPCGRGNSDIRWCKKLGPYTHPYKASAVMEGHGCTQELCTCTWYIQKQVAGQLTFHATLMVKGLFRFCRKSLTCCQGSMRLIHGDKGRWKRYLCAHSASVAAELYSVGISESTRRDPHWGYARPEGHQWAAVCDFS